MPHDPILPYQLARKTDPSTSKAAAKGVAPQLGRLHEWARKIVEENPGLTAKELGVRFSADDPARIQRRLGELVRKGVLMRGVHRVCSVTGYQAVTYRHPQGDST